MGKSKIIVFSFVKIGYICLKCNMSMDRTNVEVRRVAFDRKRYLDLLLDADPSEEMIDRYIEEGDMFVLLLREMVVGEVVVDRKGEIKNLAVYSEYRCQGYGGYLLDYLSEYYRNRFEWLWVGTSESGVGYYERNGFEYDHTIKNFFVDNYSEPIWEDGKQCVDMYYLRKRLF